MDLSNVFGRLFEMYLYIFKLLFSVPKSWWAELLRETDVKILQRKTGTRSNLKINLISQHIDPVSP
jgi:hypothetical protein